MITVKLVGENGKEIKIGKEGEVTAALHTHPPRGEQIESLPFRQYFTDNGLGTGSNAMNINGVTTPTEFYIAGRPDYDIYIKYLSIAIGDNGAPNLTKFGNENALSNGVEWAWITDELGDYELHEGIKTNLDFIRIGGDTAAIGTGVDAFLADVSGGGTEKQYLPSIDLSETFGIPWGIRLKKDSRDKLVFRVKDDLSGLLTFNIVAYGIRLNGDG